MSGALAKLDGVLARHRRLVIATWVVLVVLAAPLFARQSEHLSTGGFRVPGSQSEAVRQALRDAPGGAAARLALVVATDPAASSVQRQADVRRLVGRIDDPDVAVEPQAVSAAVLATGSEQVVVVPLTLDVPEESSPEVAQRVSAALATGVPDGSATPYLLGEGEIRAAILEVSKEDLASAETGGFPVVLLVLLAVFGSLLAASLPILVGAVAVVLTGAAIYLLSLSLGMSVFVTNMASMIGIGVAVDYSLFVLSRFRQEARRTNDLARARRRALQTSGEAVAFSGLTVVLSLSALFLVNSSELRSMALGAVLVVVIAVLVSTLLLPAVISLLGPRLMRPSRLPLLRQLGEARDRKAATASRSWWERWSERVIRHPVPAALSAVIVLGVLAAPAFALTTKVIQVEQLPPSNPARQALQVAQQALPAGALSPVQVMISKPGDPQSTGAESRRLMSELRADPAVARTAATLLSGDRTLLTVTPTQGTEGPATQDLVRRLRQQGDRSGLVQVSVGGVTAAQQDLTDQLSAALLPIFVVVLSVSFVVLLLLLRSLLLPIKAIAMNLLSVGAAYGVLTAVFTWGWFDGFFGFKSLGAIDPLVPPLVLAVTFGLSMDYEVFLLSRIREQYVLSGDPERALVRGLADSAGTITSAAAIMVSVFVVFIGTGVPTIQQIGLGNAVAVGVDATLVRLLLVPATMTMLGRWNWWLPPVLRRLLGGQTLVPAHQTAPLPGGDADVDGGADRLRVDA